MPAGQTAMQIMMGIGLAGCAGLRAWLPLFCAGLLGRLGYLPLSGAFSFLERADVLIVFGIATLLEILGDKVPVIDHLLDLAGTVARPIAGTVLSASVLTGIDPTTASLLGLIVGGGTALTIHGGKAAVRAKSTATLPLHGGVGNIALSVGEDVLALAGISLSVWAPVAAFVLAACALVVCIWMIRAAVRHGKRFFGGKRNTMGRPPAA